MEKGKSLKRRVTAWLMTLVMVASVVMVPAGKVKAASSEVDLTIPSTLPQTGEDTDYATGAIEVKLGNGGYTTLNALRTAGVQSLEVKLIVSSVTAASGQTPKVQPFINAKNYWKGTQTDVVADGVEYTLTHDLSQASGSGELWNFGLQFTGVSTVEYTISSAKLIIDTDSSSGTIDNTREESSGVAATVSVVEAKTGWTSFSFDLTNNTGQSICDWIIKLRFPSGATSSFQSWSCVYVAEGDYIYLYPMREKTNAVISGTTLTSYVPGGGCSVELTADQVTVESVTFNYGSESTIDYSDTGSSNDDGGNSTDDDYDGSLTYDLPADCVDDADTTPFDVHGKLHVDMDSLRIVDANGNPFQLRGISSHGINWGGNGEYEYEYINFSSIKKTRDILNANAMRFAMYTDEYNGYTTGGSPGELKYRVDKGVQCATALGMYAIVDWHILNSNPKNHLTQAKEFFTYVSDRYKDNDHVLYEICNEPTSGIWSDIKEYAETIIPIIRANDPDAIIIVGTPTWSQDVDIAMNNPLKNANGTLMDNVMYTIHFYANEHQDTYRQKMQTAWNTIPIFCTEYGMCAASGGGSNNFNSASTWLDMMDEHCISYFVWNLSEKDETSSLMKKGSNAYNSWTASTLSESGQWIKTQYTERKDVNNTIPSGDIAVSKVVLDKTSVSLAVGEEAALQVTVSPANATDKNITWSSSEEEVATVDQTGKIVAVSEGETEITAVSSNGKSAACTVVVKPKLESIILSIDSITIEKGKTKTISGGDADIVVTADPEGAELEAINITSADSDIVSVNNTTGVITALKAGSTTITVSSGTFSKELSVMVTVAPTGIELDHTSLSLAAGGDSVTLTATVSPDDATNKKVEWQSSNKEVVKVSTASEGAATATVTIVGKGTAKITATVQGTDIKAACDVEVTVPLTAINLSKNSLTMEKGETASISSETAAGVKVSPEPTDAALGELTFTSDKPTIVSVDEEGVMTAKAAGTAVITVASKTTPAVKNTITVTVTVKPDKITLNTASLSLLAGDDPKPLQATISPSDVNVEYTVEWSTSDDKVVTVAADETDSTKATVTVIGNGTATITAKLKNTNIEADCSVSVSTPVDSIALDTSTATLSTAAGDAHTKELKATITPSGAADVFVAWASSDPDVVKVVPDENDTTKCTVTAVGKGTATVTAMVGNKKDVCDITVIKPIEEISITDAEGTAVTSRTMAKSAEQTLKVKVTPQDASGVEKISWKALTDSGAQSDVISITPDQEDGTQAVVKALKTGTAKVEVTVGEKVGDIDNVKTAEISVSVNNLVTEVAVQDANEKTESSVGVGGTVQLTAVLSPSDADTPTSIEWTSEKSDLVSVVQDSTDNKKAALTAVKATGGSPVKITLTVKPAADAAPIVREYLLTVAKKTQAAPQITAVDVTTRTASSLVVSAAPPAGEGTAYEYSFDGGTSWQTSPEKKGLAEATSYEVKVRFAGNDDYEPSAAAEITVNAGTLLTDPYTIDVSRLPGGAGYNSDDTYMNGLYSTYTTTEQIQTAKLDSGKLILLIPDHDYTITGINTALVVEKQETSGGSDSGSSQTITLKDAEVSSVTGDSVQVGGTTTVNGEIKAEGVKVTSGTISIAGDIKADNVEIAAGNGTVKVTGNMDAGTVDIASGETNVTGNVTADAIEVKAGTANVAGDVQTDKLEVKAGSVSVGGTTAVTEKASIGGGEVTFGGTITTGSVAVTDGTVTAQKGIKTTANEDSVVISGGTVTVSGDSMHPGVSADDISISGGTVKVSGGSEAGGLLVAGIVGKTIEISDGDVTVTGDKGASGISGNVVKISGGTVTAEAGTDASAIIGALIEISAGEVTATGAAGASAISADSVHIAGGTVTATGAAGGAAIQGEKITINGGEVSASGKEGSSAISGDAIDIAGGQITASSEDGGAVIEATGSVTIKKGAVLTVNSAKKADGTGKSAISAGTITVEKDAEIKAGEDAKENLFSVTPKDENGADVDTSIYTGDNGGSNPPDGGNVQNPPDGGNTQPPADPSGDGGNTPKPPAPSGNNGGNDNNSTASSNNANEQQGDNSDNQPVKATAITLNANVKGIKELPVSGTMKLAVKKTMQLAAAFTPEDAETEALTYASSNEKIAVVDAAGRITAKKAGKTTITVTSANGLTKTFTLQVMKKPVKKVKVTALKKTVKVNKTLKLKTTITPNKKKASDQVYFISSDESIATVTQKGVVKGVKKGKVKVTATAADGSGKKAVITIKVK